MKKYEKLLYNNMDDYYDVISCIGWHYVYSENYQKALEIYDEYRKNENFRTTNYVEYDFIKEVITL